MTGTNIFGTEVWQFPRSQVQLVNERKKVACVPGIAFGPSGEGYVRCSYATGLAKIKTAMGLIGEFVHVRS